MALLDYKKGSSDSKTDVTVNVKALGYNMACIFNCGHPAIEVCCLSVHVSHRTCTHGNFSTYTSPATCSGAAHTRTCRGRRYLCQPATCSELPTFQVGCTIFCCCHCTASHCLHIGQRSLGPPIGSVCLGPPAAGTLPDHCPHIGSHFQGIGHCCS